MFDSEAVRQVLEQAPEDWKDTPEQAQLRACFIETVTGLDDVAMVRVCYELITLMRDQLMTNAAQLRRSAAKSARATMTPRALAAASGQSPQTIARLLTESRSGE